MTRLDAQIATAVLADEDTLLIFGTAAMPLPGEAAAELTEAGIVAHFRALSWPRTADEHWFLAVVAADGLSRHRPSRIAVQAPGGRPFGLPRLSHVRIDPGLLFAALQERVPEALPAAFDFLRRAVPTPSPRVQRALRTLLSAVSRPDGFGEIFGRFGEEGGLLIQGWTRSLPTGPRDLLLEGEDLVAGTALVGRFDRADLPGDAAGLVAVLADCAADPDQVRRIHYRGTDGWYHLDTFDGRTRLADGVTGPHLRDMLGRLRADADTLKTLARIANARFEGHETVSRLTQPVRIALDRAVLVPGKGVLVQGWMLDPELRATSVSLRGPGTAVRIDAGWGRTPRADVTRAFAADPLFAGRLFPGLDDHGFIAWVPCDAQPSTGWHLMLEAGADAVGFLPVPTQAPGPDFAARLLGEMDIDDPRMPELIAGHLGPMLAALGHGARPRTAAPAHALGAPARRRDLSVVMAVTDAREDLDVQLSRMATDPDFDGVEIIVAAGPQVTGTFAGRLRAAAGFYRLPVRLVPVPWARHAVEAMAAALPHVQGARVLLTNACVLPLAAGWLSDLEEVLADADGPALVSPTLLYEDFSIRFAGYRRDPDAADRPGRLVADHVGYPHAWLPDHGAQPVAAGSLDCALLPTDLARAALADGCGFVGAEAASLDVCLRLTGTGGLCLWTPDVRLVALDEQIRGERPYWQRTAALVDRWMFDRAWSTPANDAAPRAA